VQTYAQEENTVSSEKDTVSREYLAVVEFEKEFLQLNEGKAVEIATVKPENADIHSDTRQIAIVNYTACSQREARRWLKKVREQEPEAMLFARCINEDLDEPVPKEGLPPDEES
jgi:hypothetical protein